MISRPRRPNSDQHAENYSPTTESGLTPNHYVRSSGFFAYVTADLLQRSDHRSVQALETDIRTWVKGWNENPKPFIWTKSAEQILESLKRLLQRTTGAGH